MAIDWSIKWTISQIVDLSDTTDASDAYSSVYYLMMPGDNRAHTWRITVYDKGEPVDLSPYKVFAYFVRLDGTTVVLEGAVVDTNVIEVVLTKECYAFPGALRGNVRLSATNGSVISLATRLFRVRESNSTSIVDPGHIYDTAEQLMTRITALEDRVYNESQTDEYGTIMAVLNAISAYGSTYMNSQSLAVADTTFKYIATAPTYVRRSGAIVCLNGILELDANVGSIPATDYDLFTLPEWARPTETISIRRPTSVMGFLFEFNVATNGKVTMGRRCHYGDEGATSYEPHRKTIGTQTVYYPIHAVWIAADAATYSEQIAGDIEHLEQIVSDSNSISYGTYSNGTVTIHNT